MSKLIPGESVVVMKDNYHGAGVEIGDVCVVTSFPYVDLFTVRGGKDDLIWSFMVKDEGTGWVPYAPPWWT